MRVALRGRKEKRHTGLAPAVSWRIRPEVLPVRTQPLNCPESSALMSAGNELMK